MAQLRCQYCGRTASINSGRSFKTPSEVSRHELRCKKNPARLSSKPRQTAPSLKKQAKEIAETPTHSMGYRVLELDEKGSEVLIRLDGYHTGGRGKRPTPAYVVGRLVDLVAK